jgi:membrane-associated phospholipid phosphatase
MSIIPHYFNSELFFNFVKSSELSLVYINFFIALIYEKKESLFLSMLIIFSSTINYFLKHVISVPIFNMFGDYIPIFGQGSRPLGASDCGYFNNCPKKLSTSFGFPSGHSQFAGLNSGFLIRDIIYKNTKDGKFSSLKKKDKMSVILLLLFIPIMMYSRVYIEKCHTLEQTIFGATIGLILGYKSHDLYLYINKNYNNVINLQSSKKKLMMFIIFFYLTFCK